MSKNYEKCQYDYDMQLPPGYEDLPAGDEDSPVLSASRVFQSGRIQLGLSQSELGRIMGMPARHISRIENSRAPTKQQQAFMAFAQAPALWSNADYPLILKTAQDRLCAIMGCSLLLVRRLPPSFNGGGKDCVFPHCVAPLWSVGKSIYRATETFKLRNSFYHSFACISI